MTAQENAELIRSGYEAFAAGDMDTLAKLFADNIRWHNPGRHPLAGDLNGQQEVFAFFGRLAEVTGGSLEMQIEDLLASDDHVVVLVRAHARREGRELNTEDAHVWRVADGKATEYWLTSVDPYAGDEFFS